ncbi:MAG: hypothetical protein AAB642_01155, partial [Patescibacteria group bacterium]
SEALKTDSDFAQNLTPTAILYASVLMDYDRAGRGKYDTGKTYIDEDGTKKAVEENINLIGKIKTYQDSLSKGNEAETDLARAELLVAQKRTRVRWLADTETTANNTTTDPGLVKKAADKLPKITGASNLILDSLVPIAPEMLDWVERQEIALADAEEVLNLEPSNTKAVEQRNKILGYIDTVNEVKNFFLSIPAVETEETTGRDPNQLGLGISTAVAQTMSLDIEKIINEVEQRDARVKQLQSEISGTLGQWEGDQARRIELGHSGGDNEWEIFFRNRFQFAYVSYIHDFYVNKLSAEVDCDGDGIGDNSIRQQQADTAAAQKAALEAAMRQAEEEARRNRGR